MTKILNVFSQFMCCFLGLRVLCGTNGLQCQRQRNAVWRNFPPYSLGDSSYDGAGRIDGILPWVLEAAVRDCCHQHDPDVNSTTEAENAIDLERLYNTGEFAAALPVALPTITTSGHFQSLNGSATSFLPVIESPGSVFVMTVNQTKEIGSDLLNIIFDGWPLLLIIIVSAGFAGIVMWLLDRWWNPLEFPRPFIRGFWEGFWWAFVTMTTVGYGDRSPRSIPARLFGIVWIIVGVAILAVFTAIVTTEMTENTFAVEYNLEGMRVAVVNGTEEHRLALNTGAEVFAFNSHDEMISTHSIPDLDGYLMDQYFAAASVDLLERYGLGVAKFLSNPVHYGILVTGMQDGVLSCFQDYIMRHQKEIFIELTKRVDFLRPVTLNVLITPEPLFHPATITLILYTMAGWGCIVAVGIVWEFSYWRPMHRKGKGKGEGQKGVKTKTDDEKETGFSEELPTISENLTKKQQRRLRGQINSGYDDYVLPAGDGHSHSAPSTNVENDVNHPSLMRRPHLIGIGGLEGLVLRHNSEILCLEDDMINFRQNWEKKVAALQEKHRKEQLEYLNTVKYGQIQASCFN